MVKSKRRQGAGVVTGTSPPPSRGRFCETSRAKWGVRGLGAGGGPLARSRRFCAMSLDGLCAVATLTAFWRAIVRKRGPRCDFAWEPVRVWSAGSQHLTVVSCVRRCSQTTRLPCVAEGGSFFAAADPAGERAPFETIGRYAFLPVRRACAPMLRSRKSLLCNGFVHLLVSRGENEAFCWFSHDVPLVSLL